MPPANIQATSTKTNSQGKYGAGLSHNNYLDLICLVVLAFVGIIIRLSFAEKPTDTGISGPASGSIWGYGLTAIALSILVFMGLNLTSGTSKFNILKNILPIVLTLFIVLYSIYLNFSFFTRINRNAFSPYYRTYSYMSAVFIILQLIGIAIYLSNTTNTTNTTNTKNENIKTQVLSKAFVSILGIINLVFVIMIHITLYSFSTDGSGG